MVCEKRDTYVDSKLVAVCISDEHDKYKLDSSAFFLVPQKFLSHRHCAVLIYSRNFYDIIKKQMNWTVNCIGT